MKKIKDRYTQALSIQLAHVQNELLIKGVQKIQQMVLHEIFVCTITVVALLPGCCGNDPFSQADTIIFASASYSRAAVC